jgi:hypothetical protein
MLTLVTALVLAASAHADSSRLLELTRAIEQRLATTDVSPSAASQLNAELVDVQDKPSREVRAPAMLTLTDAIAYSFGTVTAGDSAEHTFKLTNVGGQDAIRLTGAAITPPFVFHGGYPGDEGTCGGDLAAGATCTLVMHFEPTEDGFANDMLTLSYFDGQSEQTVTRALSGVGHVPPKE